MGADFFSASCPSLQPHWGTFQSGHTTIFQEPAVKIPQAPLQFISVISCKTSLSCFPHPVFFILVLTAGTLHRSICGCFEHVPNLSELSCALAAISHPGRHSAGGIEQHSGGAVGARPGVHTLSLRLKGNSHLQKTVSRKIRHQQHGISAQHLGMATGLSR